MDKMTFTYPVRYNFDISTEPSIKKVAFGDGYEQRSPSGLNHMLMSYSLSFVNTRAQCDEVEGFLREHGGYKSFYWECPTRKIMILVVCENWRRSGNGGNASLQFTFREVVS